MSESEQASMVTMPSNAATICIRLVLATALGSAIGLERGAHGQPAGIRTFALVCLGSALAMITDEYLVECYGSGDPARLAAQVISGMGFIGVGTIIVTGKNYVKGLTTAASLWTTACLGIAIGAGFIFGGLIAFALVLFAMTVLSFISHRVDEYMHVIRLYMEVDPEEGVQTLIRYFKQSSYTLSSMEKLDKQPLLKEDCVLMAVINMNKSYSHTAFINELNEIGRIHYIEEIR